MERSHSNVTNVNNTSDMAIHMMRRPFEEEDITCMVLVMNLFLANQWGCKLIQKICIRRHTMKKEIPFLPSLQTCCLERFVKQHVYLFGAPFFKKDNNKGHKIKRVFARSCICNKMCHILMVLVLHRKIYVMHNNRLFGQGSRSKGCVTHICTILSTLSQRLSPHDRRG